MRECKAWVSTWETSYKDKYYSVPSAVVVHQCPSVPVNSYGELQSLLGSVFPGTTVGRRLRREQLWLSVFAKHHGICRMQIQIVTSQH